MIKNLLAVSFSHHEPLSVWTDGMACVRWVFSPQCLSSFIDPLSDWLALTEVAHILPPGLMQMFVGFALTSSYWIPLPSPPPPFILRITSPRLSITRAHEYKRGFATWWWLGSLASFPSSLTNEQTTWLVLDSELRVEATYVTSGLPYERASVDHFQLCFPPALLYIMLSSLYLWIKT